MRNHPLTPMTDANLVRFLGHQTPNGVGLIPYEIVLYGPDAIASACKALRGEGKRFGVIDALTDEDLFTIGAAATNHRLITGGSGIALGLPENFRRANLLGTAEPPRLPNAAGRAAVIAGSCSSATRSQVWRASRDWPTLLIDSRAVARGEAVVEEALAWADKQSADKPILIYSSATPEVIAEVQREFGRAVAGERVEQAFGRIAQGLVDQGVRRLVVAGGETSGAVVSALGVNGLRIGPEIDPGVPWTETLNIPTLALALKSGNFGGEDFFSKAIEMLP
jgi:uncharacterized protein YgbK (DUF1537 family)